MSESCKVFPEKLVEAVSCLLFRNLDKEICWEMFFFNSSPDFFFAVWDLAFRSNSREEREVEPLRKLLCNFNFHQNCSPFNFEGLSWKLILLSTAPFQKTCDFFFFLK